jgi:putative PEP-CTERM system TPR-repeat lipoprotein
MLRGTVYVAKRDLKNARANFEKALELQPDSLQAAQQLAAIDLQEGNLQAALARYDRLIAKNPRNEGLLLGQAELLAMSGAPNEKVKASIDKAVAATPTSVRARLAMINFEARRNDSKGALNAAREGLSAIPNDPQLLQALGIAQLAAGERNQAVDTFKSLTAVQRDNPSVWVRLANVQLLLKDYPGAVESGRKALALKPDMPQALAVVTKAYFASGQIDTALAEARRLQKDQPKSALGYVIEAELLTALKKPNEAIAAYKKAMELQPTSTLAVRYYVALDAAGKATDATALAASWSKQHPDDPAVPLFLAERSQARKNFPAAKSQYQHVLEIDPDNAVALNNLAWLLAEEKDPKALEFAERAHRVAPFNPNVLDTLGWTLARSGQAKRGVDLLRIATRLAPTQPEIRLHLAKALVDSGDKAGARKEIAELTKLNKESPVRIEAEKLQATL